MSTRDRRPGTRVSDDDSALFRSAVGDVRPLDDDRARPRPGARRAARRIEPAQPSAQPSDALLADDPAHDAPGAGERQQFARPGVQTRVLRRLARGQVAVEEDLDLHGMRVDDARRALAAFLAESAHHGRRCVRVVTGKGFRSPGAEPVLKARVDRWLRLRPEVLAFCSAVPRDGGTGAVYVLLRRVPRPD